MTARATVLPPVLVAPEGPAEDIRNALNILGVAMHLSPGGETVLLGNADAAAICARLWAAVEKLERHPNK